MTTAEVKQLVERLTEIADDSRSVAPRSLVLQAASALTLLAQEREELREALRDIADGRGVCGTCGTLATGPAGGLTDCECTYPVWRDRDPKEVARAALKDT